MPNSEAVQTVPVQMNDVLDDALVCISGNRYTRTANGWRSSTSRLLSLDTIARLKQRNMIFLDRGRNGVERPRVTSLGEDRVDVLNRRRADRAKKGSAKKPASDEARP